MKRFDFEEEDDEENNNDEMFNQGFFSMIPMEESEEDLIDKSIKICEKNYFWKFYTIDKKLKDLEKTYEFLQSLSEKGDI